MSTGLSSTDMNIDKAKKLLSDNGISFIEKDFATQREYWEHCSEFWHIEHASTSPDSRRKALVIPCANGKKDIELEFELKDDEFVFADLLFGSFSFEILDFLTEGETVEDEIMKYLPDILKNRYTVLTVNQVGRGVIMDSYRINVSEEDRAKLLDAYGRAQTIWGKLLRRRYAIELYDRNSYVIAEFNDLDRARKNRAVEKWWTLSDNEE